MHLHFHQTFFHFSITQAISTAGLFAGPNDAQVTLLLIEEPGTKTADPEKQKGNLSWHLHENGCDVLQSGLHRRNYCIDEKPRCCFLCGSFNQHLTVLIKFMFVHQLWLNALRFFGVR